MTNAEIILQNRVFLMEQEVIKGIPGTSMVWTDEQGRREIAVPEEIRTCREWNELGFVVKKGEHAIAKFQIWMPKKGKGKAAAKEEEQQEEGAPKGFYKKVAHFFTEDQVKPMEDKKEVAK